MRILNFRVMLIFLFSLLSSFACLAQNSIVGNWKTIDDETGRPKAIIKIYEESGELRGQIIQLFRYPEDIENPVCDKCVGERQGRPVLNMVILWGLKKQEEGKWSGGEILDPKKGKIYSAKVELIDEAKRLKVRGFLGFSLLGRTQIWERQAQLPSQ